MLIIEKRQQRTFALPVKELKVEKIKVLSSDLSRKIVLLLAKTPSYPKKIAKHLKEHEQKIYYHIKNLEKAGIIRKLRSEMVQGAVANIYEIVEQGFMFKFSELKETTKITASKQETHSFLHPFIKDGQLNALIVVGSPDPHGPEMARSRDGYYGMDLALFLGTYLNYVPDFRVKLDTEVQESDLKNNLILIGGPIVNKVTGKIQDKMKIYFNRNKNNIIFSSISNNEYPSEETGIIVKLKNPFNKDKSILVVAGRRHQGTKAAIIAFLKKFDDIVSGNKFNNKVFAKVVEGVDLDSDGIIDDVEVRE